MATHDEPTTQTEALLADANDHTNEDGRERGGEEKEEEEEEGQPPIPVTPGYLATRLNTVFNNALAHTLKTCSYSNFAACFPTPAARRPDVLRTVWQQIVGKIETKANSEYENIMSERDVVRGLNELEQLIKDAKARKERSEREGGEEPVALHTLPPEALFGAHLVPELEPMARELQSKVDEVSAENDKLAAAIVQQREQVEALMKQVEAAVKDLEGANDTLEGVVNEHGIRQLVLDVQRDMNEVGKL